MLLHHEQPRALGRGVDRKGDALGTEPYGLAGKACSKCGPERTCARGRRRPGCSELKVVSERSAVACVPHYEPAAVGSWRKSRGVDLEFIGHLRRTRDERRIGQS